MQPSPLNAIIQFAEASDQVSALILIGSQARTRMKADAFSDIDLIMVVKDADPFIRSDTWLQAIGNVHISFTEHTVDGQMEKRVMFDDAQDVDFVIMNESAALQALKQGDAAAILSRGYRVLVDKLHLAMPQPHPLPIFTPATEPEFTNLVQDFWFHTIWVTKKLLRSEVWAAKFCVDGYMKQRLLWMIEQHEHIVRKSGDDTWYGGRFIDRWAGEDILRDLSQSFAHYDRVDIAQALAKTMLLFRRLAVEVAQNSGFVYPAHADDYAAAWVGSHLAALIQTIPHNGGAV
ncbi:MAG TPA: aminoglycoside 6-adenylyltransferase [Candidatus Limiplasma sp.]|nr:aminoglycoside 6-adenylyltransferase [Candidatus Limiplasma sp.]HRX08310.1 aminoglycoside 6-adenylyltransferase [Candidatus Limiplasma sp.]